MPEDESDAEVSRDQPKASRRKEWRDKISRKVSKAVRSAEKPSPEVHNDVADFLQGSGNPAGQVPLALPKELAPVKPTPALNPPPSDGLLALSQISRPSTAQSSQSQSVQVLTARQRERRALKLHVQFTTAEPEIIGEGGDEAELPSREVTTGWYAANQVAQPGLLIDLSNPDDKAKGNAEYADSRNVSQELFLPESLQTRPVDRKSTRLDRKPVSLTGIGGPQVADENADRVPRWSKLPGTPAKDVFNLKGTEPHHPSEIPAHESGLAEVTHSHNSSIDSPGLTNKIQEDLIKPFASATIAAQTKDYVANQSIDPIPSNMLQLKGNGQSRRPVPPPPLPLVAPSISAGNTDRERMRPPSSIELAVDHFYANVQHLNNVFRLAAETYQSPTEVGFADWIRACIWWFLKGSDRLEMTSLTESHGSNSVTSSPDGSAFALKQAYIDLAKAWWIMNEVLPRYIQQEDQNTQASGGDEYLGLLEVYSGIQASMRGLSAMMEKRQLLPPSSLLIQGADTRIWIRHPTLSTNLGSLLTNLTPRKLLKQSPSEFRFFGIPLMDTNMHFTFGKMFVDAEIVLNNDHDTDTAEALQLPCILSIIRKRTSPEAEFTLVSQDNSINLHIQSNRKFGPTWSEIEWRKKSHTLRIRIARDLELVLRFWEKDFRVLFGIYEYACKLQYYWEPYPDEKLKFDKVVRTFHYVGQPQNSMMFPTDPIRQCKIRVFQKIFITGEHSGKHRLFAGHRVVVFTPPGIKTSSHISQDFRQKDPLMFKYLRGEAEAPALMLDVRDKESYAMVITFDSVSARAELHSILAGTFVYQDEVVSERVPLSKFVISGGPMDQLQSAESLLPIKGIQWQDLQVINKASDPVKDGIGFSQHLRVCLSCNYGTLTDRLNLAPGDLLLGLDPTELTLMKIRRPPQESLTACFAQNVLPAGGRDMIMRLLETLSSSALLRTLQFRNLKDLHQFQSLITGYSVHFDSTASSFGISRRRMVVPIYKRLEASRARIQVISPANEKPSAVQILAFFSEDFVLGRSMSFEVKSIDVLESFAKSSKFFVRFVDAKFALPKSEKADDAEFVSIDAPEYPSEHDDIVIGFDKENERDEFTNVLPVSVAKASRLGALGALRR